MDLVGQCHAAHFRLDGGEPEDREPDQGEQSRCQQHAADKFADGTTAGDSGDEEADVGGPGNGPGPVKDGPVPLPVGIGPGLGPEGQPGQVIQVGTDGFHHALEDQQRRPEYRDQQCQQQREQDVKLGQPAYAAVEAEGDRNAGDTRNDRDQDDLHPCAGGRTEEEVQPAVQLHCPEPEGGGDAKQGAQHGDHVDHLAQGAVHALAEQRVEQAADTHGQGVTVGKVGNGQAGQGENGPGVQAEVVERQGHRLSRRVLGAGLDTGEGRGGEVGDRLGDTPEHEDGADAGGEQHGKPGGVAVIRPGVIRAQANAPVAPQCECQ